MFGMKLPQGDRPTKSKGKVPPELRNATAPKMPQGDGPSKSAPAGRVAGKPPTSAPPKGKKGPIGGKQLKSMKSSLGSIGSF